MELTSDTDIYFNFVFECNDWDFKHIKANQNFFIKNSGFKILSLVILSACRAYFCLFLD